MTAASQNVKPSEDESGYLVGAEDPTAEKRERRRPARPRFPQQFIGLPSARRYLEAQTLAMQAWVAWIIDHYRLSSRVASELVCLSLAQIETHRELTGDEMYLILAEVDKVWTARESAETLSPAIERGPYSDYRVRLNAIKERLAAATPGHWRVVDCRHQKGGQIKLSATARGAFAHIANILRGGPRPLEDAVLISRAHEDIEWLVDMIESLQRAYEDLEQRSASNNDRAQTMVSERDLAIETLQRRLELPDPAHRCSVCKVNYVDSDAGFDTCEACLSRI